MDLFDDIRLFLTKPKKAFAKKQKASFREALKYAAIMLLIYVVISTIATSVFLLFAPALVPELTEYKSLGIAAVILFIPLIYLFEFAVLLLAGVWFHLFALIFGAKKGLKQTIIALIYGRTPYYLFAWIPFIGGLASVWSWVLYGFGIKKLQNLSTGRTVLTVVLGVAIPFLLRILLIVLATGLLISLAEAGGISPLPTNFTLPSLP